MTFSSIVKSVKKRKDGGHTVTYLISGRQHTWECDAVGVCSGLHVEPSIPEIKGIERVPQVFHSSVLKKRDQFGVGKTVLILGSGETGADVSILAVTSPTKRVVLCHRDGFHLAPKVHMPPRKVCRFPTGAHRLCRETHDRDSYLVAKEIPTSVLKCQSMSLERVFSTRHTSIPGLGTAMFSGRIMTTMLE